VVGVVVEEEEGSAGGVAVETLVLGRRVVVNVRTEVWRMMVMSVEGAFVRVALLVRMGS
jgi:hypothetical protein